MADYFHYDGVEECMNRLGDKFTEFEELLRKANNYVNDNIGVDKESAIYGEHGKKILNVWNDNASSFAEFYKNFEMWNEIVASMARSYTTFYRNTMNVDLGLEQLNISNLSISDRL